MSLTLYQRRRESKKQQFEYLVNEIPKHRGFLVVGITGVKTSTFQSVRKALKGKATIRVVKNTVLSKALDKISLPDEVRSTLKSKLSREIAVVFTDDSVFSVTAELLKFKRSAFIKPNRSAPLDVIIPAGVTPLQPGPLTDSLTALGIPFEVKKNLVYIKQDMSVVKKGDRVNARVAELLRALDIAPLISSFELKLALEDGLYIPGEQLNVDLSKYIKDLSFAHADALTLSVNLGIPTPEAMPLIVAKAVRSALAVSVEAGYPSAEALPLILLKGVSAAKVLSELVGVQ
ncbi:MAG: 50S ribosomal protein L10 [Thermoprotei archaeon]